MNIGSYNIYVGFLVNISYWHFLDELQKRGIFDDINWR